MLSSSPLVVPREAQKLKSTEAIDLLSFLADVGGIFNCRGINGFDQPCLLRNRCMRYGNGFPEVIVIKTPESDCDWFL